MRNLLLLIFTLCLGVANAQVRISGTVIDEKRQALPYVSVGVDGGASGTVTNEKGEFELRVNKKGAFQVVISSVGFEAKTISVQPKGAKVKLGQISLKSEQRVLEAVEVKGKATHTEIAEKPITVNTLNVKAMQSESNDVTKLLDKVQGVKIRQTGGLGSRASISLNGLTGRAIRFYYNGIPVEYLGRGFSLQNLPLSNITRIEVYKGVMPADIGTDALGGGVNIVTSQELENRNTFSYEIGSFGTHKASVSVSKRLSDRWFMIANVNHKRSDNDYLMKGVRNNVYDERGFIKKVEEIDVRRFHDGYSFTSGGALFGYTNEAKDMDIRISVNGTTGSKEYQHGLRLGEIPFGELEYSESGANLNFDFRKRWSDAWQLRYFANASRTNIQAEDPKKTIPDGRETNTPALIPAIKRTDGTEYSRFPLKADINVLGIVQKLSLNRVFESGLEVSANHFFGLQSRDGKNKYKLSGVIDPNEKGSHIMKNISSVEVRKAFFKDKLETSFAIKNYNFWLSSLDLALVETSDAKREKISDNAIGYNAALKFTVNDNIFLRASFEDALRIPDRDELFGDLGVIQSNINLKPERSKNLNLGAKLRWRDFLIADINYFMRNQRDLIRLEPDARGTARYINQDKVKTRGVEMALSGTVRNHWEYAWNTTYQESLIDSFEDPSTEFLVGRQVPNIPVFFSNLELAYKHLDLFNQGQGMRVALSGNFVDEFMHKQDAQVRNDDNWVPVQQSVDLSVTYLLREALTISFRTNNLLDAELYDFFEVPKPGRNYALKIRYSF